MKLTMLTVKCRRFGLRRGAACKTNTTSNSWYTKFHIKLTMKRKAANISTRDTHITIDVH